MLNIKNFLSQGNTSFYQFTDADDRIWLLPERNMTTAMDLYHPKVRREIIVKEWFPALHRIPFASMAFRVIRNKYSLNPEMQSVIQDAFGADDIEYSILGGRPYAPHRITIQFFKGRRILGYGKITDNADVESLLIKEQIMLDYLKRQHLKKIPKSLSVRRLKNGYTLSLQTSEKRMDSHSPEIWTPMHEDFINDMAVRTAVPAPFLESDFYRNMCELTRHMDVIPEEFRSIISDALHTVHNEFGVDTYIFSAYHGNFIPRNIFVNGRNLFVEHWENSELTYPPTLDRYHFFMQRYNLSRRFSALELFGHIRRHEWFDAKLFRCYILHMVYHAVCHSEGKISNEISEKLKIWSNLLFYISRHQNLNN